MFAILKSQKNLWTVDVYEKLIGRLITVLMEYKQSKPMDSDFWQNTYTIIWPQPHIVAGQKSSPLGYNY